MDDAILNAATDSAADSFAQTDSIDASGAPAEPRKLVPRRPRLLKPVDAHTPHLDSSSEARPSTHGDEARPALPAIVEALLFASDAPLTAARLAELAECGAREVEVAMLELNEKYEAAQVTFRIAGIAGGYRLMTLAHLSPWVSRLHHSQNLTRLSEAVIETLSVITYRQPITRVDVESVRGVACADAIRRLIEFGLVKVVGKAEIVGRPNLYGTTRKFLDHFGLRDLGELPQMEKAEPPNAAGIDRAGRGEPEEPPARRAATGT
jgi:segregation and condensation protein B